MQTVSQTQIFSLLSWMLFAPHRGFPSPGSDVYYPSVKEDASLTGTKVMLDVKLKFAPTLVFGPGQLAPLGFQLGEDRKVSRLQRCEKVKTVDWKW